MFEIVHFGESSELTKQISEKFNTDYIVPNKEVFSNGEVIFTLSKDLLFQKDVVVICSGRSRNTNNYIMELLILLALIKGDKPSSLHLVLPLLPYSRQDRKFGMHQPMSLRLIAQLFESFNIDSIFTLDLHSPQSESVFRIPVYNLTALPTITQKIIEDNNLKDFLICVPDSGSLRRGINIASYYNCDIEIFKKKRYGQESVEISEVSHDVLGRDIILIDDMVDRGATIGKCITSLRRAGARRIFVAITHSVMSQSDNGFEEYDYDAYYTTNSIYQKYNMRNVNIISIEDIVADAIASTILHKQIPTAFLEDSWFVNKVVTK